MINLVAYYEQGKEQKQANVDVQRSIQSNDLTIKVHTPKTRKELYSAEVDYLHGNFYRAVITNKEGILIADYDMHLCPNKDGVTVSNIDKPDKNEGPGEASGPDGPFAEDSVDGEDSASAEAFEDLEGSAFTTVSDADKKLIG